MNCLKKLNPFRAFSPLTEEEFNTQRQSVTKESAEFHRQEMIRCHDLATRATVDAKYHEELMLIYNRRLNG